MSKIAIVTVLFVGGLAARGLADEPGDVLAVAQQLNAKLASAEAKLTDATEQLFVAVEATIAEISTDGQSLDPALRTLAGLRALLKDLRPEGQKVVAAHHVFVDAARGYDSELARAPSALDSLAVRYRQFAAEETYEDLRQRYQQDADTVLAVKALLVARRAELGPQVQLVEDNRRYVERTVVYLGRLEELLNSFPDLLDGEKTERFLAMLKRYVDHFGRLKHLLEGFHAKVTTGQGSYTQQPRDLKALVVKQSTHQQPMANHRAAN